MEIFPSTYSKDVPKVLEKEYRKARIQVKNSSRDFFKVSGLVKECFIDGVSKIELSDLGFRSGMFIYYEWPDMVYTVSGYEYIEDVVKGIMAEVYKNIILALKRNQYTLEKTQTADTMNVLNKKGVKVGVLTRKIKKSSYSYSNGFLLTPVKQEAKDTTVVDDKVIKQMLTLCEKGNRVFLNAADEALELQNAIEDGELFDDGDELYEICLPANQYIKQLFILCRKIKNPELKEAVLNCLDDVTNGAEWDEVLQYWADETGWDAVGGIDEWAEVTFGAYLKTHDIHVFDSVREYY